MTPPLLAFLLAVPTWDGTYTFDEASGQVTGAYVLTVKGRSADLDVDGFQTLVRLRADVEAHGDEAEFRFSDYRPDNVGTAYKPGQLLFTLTRRGKELKTRWHMLQPLLRPSRQEGFRKKP
jgi:hypothetical protein